MKDIRIDEKPIKMVEPDGASGRSASRDVDVNPASTGPQFKKEKPKGTVVPDNGYGNIDWLRLALATGGGLIGHSIASSMFDGKTDDEKRRESIWIKLLSALMPIGAGAIGAYGGYRLGGLMKTSAETNDWVSVTDGKNFNMNTPKEYSHQVAEMLKLMDERPEITLEDILEQAKKFSDQSGSEKWPRLGSNIAAGAEALSGLGGLGLTSRGLFNMYASNENVIRSRANKSLKVPSYTPATTAIVPRPNIWRRFLNWVTYKTPNDASVIRRYNNAVLDRMEHQINTKSDRFWRGAKQTGFGIATLGGSLLADKARKLLDEEVRNISSKVKAGDEYRLIHPDLEKRIREATPVSVQVR